jgi:hypothetical protein
MNNKGEVNYVGVLLILAITLIVGIVLFQVIAQEVGRSTNTVSIANQSLPSTVVNGTAQYITNCRALSGVEVYNETGAAILVGSGNYTVTDNSLDTQGNLAVKILPDASAPYKSKWKVSGTCQPTTYIADGGARSMAGLIVVMFALALAVVALTPTLREGLLEALGK